MDALDCANLSSDKAPTDSTAAGSTYSTATHNAKSVAITVSLNLPNNFSTKANVTNAVSDASGGEDNLVNTHHGPPFAPALG